MKGMSRFPNKLWLQAGLLFSMLAPASRLYAAPPPSPPTDGEVSGESRLTLADAIREALGRNGELQLKRLSAERRALEILRTEDDLSWSIRPYSTFGGTDEGMEGRAGVTADKTTSTGGRISAEASLARYPEFTNDRWRSDARAELSQPLLHGAGRRAAREPVTKATEAWRAERRAWEDMKSKTVLETVRLYEECLRLEHEASLQIALAARAAAWARRPAYEGGPGDAARSERMKQQSAARAEQLRAQWREAIRALALITGRPLDQLLKLEPAPRWVLPHPTQEEALHIAFSNRLDYAQALEDTVSAHRGAILARDALQPDISLLVRGERLGLGNAWDESVRDVFDHRVFAGLSLQGDLLRKHERWNSREAELASVTAEETLRLRGRAIAHDVLQALDRYTLACREETAARQSARLAAARARRARSMAGGDISEVQLAEVEAHQRVLAAESAASISAYALLRALGTLVESPDDLKPQNAEPAL